MTEHKPKLKVGQVWRSRDCKTVTIDSKDNHPRFPFNAYHWGLFVTYTEDGKYWDTSQDSQYDLVELISEAPTLATPRPFSELTKDFTPERKARIKQQREEIAANMEPKEDITMALTEYEVSYLNHCLDVVFDAGVEEDDQAIFEILKRKVKDLYEEHCVSYRLSPAMEAYHAKYGTFGTSQEETPRWEAFRDAFNAGMEAARANSDG